MRLELPFSYRHAIARRQTKWALGARPCRPTCGSLICEHTKSDGWAQLPLTLDHIQLAIPSDTEDKARAFWTGQIGLAEMEKPQALVSRDGCWFKLGHQELHLGVQDPFVPATKAHPGFLTDDIDALAAKLENVRWDEALRDRRRFFTSDPFGNRLEFIEKS